MNGTTKFGLPFKVINALNSIFESHSKVEEVIIYGSRAKGNFRPGSDIDLTLRAPELTTGDLLKIENEIDDLMLPYKVDLSLLHQIEAKDLLEHIEKVGLPFRAD